ncbi:conserved hypothetical protein [Ruegeria lacuscaerulensis ITI-1157]|nr:conserved hypothetical protein [Ruegeria lacuscaerulensis ITI-1157]SHJ45264.1 hypothetical protein SAMN05444404_2122 [Ruegeria lacuscaerulensis ITI-1157]
MSRLLLLLLAILLGPAPVNAGAWLRQKDSSFSALSVTGYRETNGSAQFKYALYSEWGLREKLTIGLDAEEHQLGYGHALLFARLPVADLGVAGRLAAEFGIGAHHQQLQAWALYKATLSWGKGFQTGYGGGWLAVDAALEYRTHNALFRKLDLTAGFSSQRRIDPMLQIETAYVPGRPFYWSARPSVLIRPDTGPNTWVLGLERTADRRSIGVRFSLWREF